MKKILLTSPQGYAERLVRAFEESTEVTDLWPVSVPMIQTDILPESPEMLHLLQHLADYDYLAFSSRKAIESFAAACQQNSCTLPDSLQLCAIGKDNEALHELLHCKPSFISDEPSPAGIVKHLSTVPESSDRRIAVLAPNVIDMKEPDIVPNFLKGLEEIGLRVTRVTAYQTSACAAETLSQLRQAILNDTYHAVLFTSGTEIKVFLRMLESDWQYLTTEQKECGNGCQANEDLLKHLQVLCYGPYTASVATHLGVHVDFTSPSYGSFQELVRELHIYYR